MPRSRKRKPGQGRKRLVSRPTSGLDYYQIAFRKYLLELKRRGYSQARAPSARRSFWSIVPPGRYDHERGRDLILSYATRVELGLSEILQKHSLAYWLHAYRRIEPWYPEASPTTIGLVRGTFEAAVQKYAPLDPCSGIGSSTETSPEAVLNGQLVADRMRGFIAYLRKHRQLVLTKFGPDEMQELYDAERLCHELWRCAATLRILGKQASLFVSTDEVAFRDDRSSELNSLVVSYDERGGRFNASASGTAFKQTEDRLGWIALPIYNIQGIKIDDVAPIVKLLTGEDVKGDKFNFVWQPFDIASYYKAHVPFEDAFREEKGVMLRDVMTILATLGARVLASWRHGLPPLYRHWQRAYEGPYTWSAIREDLLEFLPNGLSILRLDVPAEEIDVDSAMQFLTLKQSVRSQIDLLLVGPHWVFLPYGQDRAFVDYAWIMRLLYNLFFGVRADDENFKGEALEEIVRREPSPIPSAPCKSLDGQERQFDAAFSIGRVLVVAECRAFARSFGFERGDPRAIQYRTERIDRALDDVDRKAMWLGSRPIGTNYNISAYDWIVPVAVTPFVEFIPSLAPRWWLTRAFPRILTPKELEQAIASGIFELPLLNAIPVASSGR